MSVIHMEVETVTELANRMQLLAESLTQKHQSVKNETISIDWEGDASNQFSADINSVINNLDRTVDELLIASRRVKHEVDQWVSVDNSSVNRIPQKAPKSTFSLFEQLGLGWRQAITLTRAKIKPYQLDEVWDYLKTTKTGKDLENLAYENGVCFIFPDGTKIGDPNAVVQVPIDYGKTEWGGYFDPGTSSIVISGDKFFNDQVSLSETLAHEMQHAIDHASGKFLPFPNIAGQTEAQLEASLSRYLDAKIHSEIRAYERSENITWLTPYFDDGILTGAERNKILNHSLSQGTYRTYYENSLTDILADSAYTASVSVHPVSGELVVDLLPIAQPLQDFSF